MSNVTQSTRLVTLFILCLTILTLSCGGGGGETPPASSGSGTSPVVGGGGTPPATGGGAPPAAGGGGGNTPGYTILSTATLNADGPGGQDTYTLIRSVFGPDSIEAPDLYPSEKNHTGFHHIQEESDGSIGNHFVFYIHRDLDWDRDEYPTITDRQRNEIKTYDGSAENLKARLGETFIIQWKFKINSGMTVSNNFTHFFQLKAVKVGGEDDNQPIMTISGMKRSGNDYIEVLHNVSSAPNVSTILAQKSWTTFRDEWLTVYCQATFTDNGSLYLTVRKADGTILLEVDQTGIDMWRPDCAFVRPKWGIYRSLLNKDNLREAEETVRFANFSISKALK